MNFLDDLIDPDASPVGHEFRLLVDDKRILALLLDERHPEFQVSPVHWRRFSGAELWGFLRHWPIDRVLMTLGDYVRLVVLIGDGESTAYIKIGYNDWLFFLDHLCKKDSGVGHDWRTEGF